MAQRDVVNVGNTDSLQRVKDFRQACCEFFGCMPEEYEQAVFWHCLHDHALVPAKIIWRLSRSFFAWDLQLVRTVANATAISELEQEINNYRYQYRVSGILRRQFRIRLSGQKLLHLATQVWELKKSARGGEVKRA